MASNTLQLYVTIITVLCCVQGHPGAGGEPGLIGVDGCNGTRGLPGVSGIPGLDGIHGPPVSRTPALMFLLAVNQSVVRPSDVFFTELKVKVKHMGILSQKVKN